MAEAVLHIGFNKCGSTAIQTWLEEQRGWLRDKGIFWDREDPRPRFACANPQFFVLAHTLARRPVPDLPIFHVLGLHKGDTDTQVRLAHEVLDRVQALATRDDLRTFVMSSEFFVSPHVTKAIPHHLHGWLQQHFERVRYVAYIRQPLPWLISLHGHLVKQNKMDETLEHFLTTHKAWFRPRLELWRAGLPQGIELDVRLFEESWLSGDGLLDDFAQLLGLTKAPGTRAAPVNRVYRAPTAGLRQQISAAAWRLKPRPRVAPDLARLVHDRHADDMAWIAETFFAGRRDAFRAWAGSPAPDERDVAT